jgi:hypothetical protein
MTEEIDALEEVLVGEPGPELIECSGGFVIPLPSGGN